MAEWLRRLTRNQFPSGSVGSSPTDCVNLFLFFSFFSLSPFLSVCHFVIPSSCHFSLRFLAPLHTAIRLGKRRSRRGRGESRTKLLARENWALLTGEAMLAAPVPSLPCRWTACHVCAMSTASHAPRCARVLADYRLLVHDSGALPPFHIQIAARRPCAHRRPASSVGRAWDS